MVLRTQLRKEVARFGLPLTYDRENRQLVIDEPVEFE